MKKMMFILMILTACLASAAFADAPVDITNPSFEDQTGGECDAWTLWSGGGATESVYHDGDAANARSGDAYFEVGTGGAGWSGIHTDLGQEVEVTPGTDVGMIMFAKTADGSAQTGSVIMRLEFYATQGEGWAEGPFAELSCDTTGSYQVLDLYTTVPDGMNYVRATIVSTETAVHVDDVWVGIPWTPPPHPPTSPQPRDGSIQSVKNAPSYGYTPVTALSWNNPFPLNGTDPLGIEIKFAVGGDWTLPGASTVTGTDIESVDLSALSPPLTLPLADDTSYYWQVTVTDPDTSGSGTPMILVSPIWTFSTGDAKPIVQEPVDQYMWLDQEDGDGDPTIRTFTVTTTYTDDGKSAIVDANFTTPDWLWEDGNSGVIEVSDVHTPDPDDPGTGCKSGTVVATYKTVALGDDPARPADETTIPGWWNMILEVTDATDRTTSGNTGYYRIDATCAEAAAAGGDEDFDATYDANSDCIINIVDFAAFSKNWLAQSPKFE